MSHPETPVAADTRHRLLQAAREAFMKEGYRASVDNIAARAGVAKQTLYNHFPSKDELFSETATLSSAAIAVTLDGQTEDVRASLIRFATTFREKILGDEGLAMFRALTAETTRFPGLAQAFFAKGPAQTIARLADFLGRAMADNRLRQDDPRLAAEMLVGMLGGFEHASRLCGAATPAVVEKTRIEQIVDCFLRAYAPNH
ncbi:MAG: TetR/AcrR family transcriptional regulator [Burkholderiales bacterium]|nr:TetR/AcrR family transcriptional regulator [Burkholderiales bacterium]